MRRICARDLHLKKLTKMLNLRELLLKTIESEAFNELTEIVTQQNARIPAINLTEAISELTNAQREQFWKVVRSLTEKLGQDLFRATSGENDTSASKDFGQATRFLSGVIGIICTLIKSGKIQPEEIFPIAVFLHDSIPDFSNEFRSLQYRIALMCEAWWCANLEGRERISEEAMCFLIKKTLGSDFLKSDIKRVYGMKDCLRRSTIQRVTMKMLCSCATSPAYLKANEGCKFIAFLLILSIRHMEAIHLAVKGKLAQCDKKGAVCYGDIYIKAWYARGNKFRTELETDCIQDIMSHCIHSSSSRFTSTLLYFLGQLHAQQVEKEIGNMLFRLYQPILWRSLKVANSIVRKNACAIFFDLFPLEDPMENIVDCSEEIQKQMNLIEELIYDPSPDVRCTAIVGVCEMFRLYWNLIPSKVIKGFLDHLVNDMAFDASSAMVRRSVFKGITNLVQNPLSHSLLSQLLPKCGQCIHDVSDLVRLEFLHMLQALKGLKDIKYWLVTPPKDLLHRLANDMPSNCRRIVSLLMNSYHPLEKSDDILLSRCLQLISTDRSASRYFYTYAGGFMSLNGIVHFILLVKHLLLDYAEWRIKEDIRNGLQEEMFVDPYKQTDNEDDDGIHLDKNRMKDFSEMSMNELGGLLDAVCLLWTNAKAALNEQQNKLPRNKLLKTFSVSMSVFFKAFRNTEVFSSLLYLSSFIPASMVHVATSYCMAQIRSLDPSEAEKKCSMLLDCLCNWGRADDVLELISRWLTEGYMMKNNLISSVEPRRTVRFYEPYENQPYVAVLLLSNMLKRPICQNQVLTKERAMLTEIVKLLRTVEKVVEQRFSAGTITESSSNEFLILAFQTSFEITLLLHEKEETSATSSVDAFGLTEIFDWMKLEVLSYLKTIAEAVRDGDEHLNGSTQTLKNICLAFELIKVTLRISSSVILIGYSNNYIGSQTANFCIHVLESGVWSLTEESGTVLVEVLNFVHCSQRHVASMRTNLNIPLICNIIQIFMRALSAFMSAFPDHDECLPKLKKTFSNNLVWFDKTSRKDMLKILMAFSRNEVISEISQEFVERIPGSFKKEALSKYISHFSSFMLQLLCKNSFLLRIFLNELNNYFSCTSLKSTAEFLACVTVLLACSKEKAALCSIKEDIVILEDKIRSVKVSSSDSTSAKPNEVDCIAIEEAFVSLKGSLGIHA